MASNHDEKPSRKGLGFSFMCEQSRLKTKTTVGRDGRFLLLVGWARLDWGKMFYLTKARFWNKYATAIYRKNINQRRNMASSALRAATIRAMIRMPMEPPVISPRKKQSSGMVSPPFALVYGKTLCMIRMSQIIARTYNEPMQHYTTSRPDILWKYKEETVSPFRLTVSCVREVVRTW